MQKIINWGIVLIAFFSIFIIEWYTPLHSDDYSYAMLGISFDAHMYHYLTWSGRVVADYSSALLLATKSPFVISIFTGLLVITFCYFIVKIPTGTLRWKKNDASLFSMIFLTFWVANPNIGQTTFWVVGSANYLWTNLFVVIWMWNLYRIQIKREKKVQITMLILGLLAGCSNESIAPFVVGISALTIVHDLWKNKRVILNKYLYFISTLLGASILIFSPGNFIRANGEDWYKMPLLERIATHISHRVFGHLALIWIAYVVLAILSIILVYAHKKGFRFSKANLQLIVLSMLIGIGASLIMVAAPLYPDRVMMSTFLFFLIAISFLAQELLNTENKSVTYSISAINIILFGVFIWSFSLMYNSYIHVHQQNMVRLKIIKTELKKHKRHFTIPDFHFLKMQNRGGEFDFWHDPKVYGKYFGTQSIERKTTGFDYSIIVSGKSQKINANANAWFDGKGHLLLISTQQLTGSVAIFDNGKMTSMPLDDFKTVQINEDYWYYTHISNGLVTGIYIQ